jgi:hypothetical protein
MAKRLDELEALLNRIWSGELKHTQTEIINDCSTAACVCGWDYAIDLYGGDLSLTVRLEFSAKPYRHTCDKYDLSSVEGVLMLCASSTRKLQKLTLEALKAGRTISQDLDICVESEDYESEDFTIVLCKYLAGDNQRSELVDAVMSAFLYGESK